MKKSIILIFTILSFSCTKKIAVDTLVINATIYTVNSNFDKAEAFAIKDGKIIHKDKSYNTFVLESFFCEKGIISLIDNR